MKSALSLFSGPRLILSVALIMAKTESPFLRFIRFTEPVVIIEVTGPAAVLMTISETTLSETICSIVPGKRLRMLVLMTLCRYFNLSHGFGSRKWHVRFPNMMSSIGDRHLNLRYRSRFEPPLCKRVGRHLIENRITCALCHHRAGNPAAPPIDQHNADTAASNMGVLRLVRIIGKRGANCHSFCSRQRRRRLASHDCALSYTRSLFFRCRSGCCQLFWRRCLPDDRSGLFIWCRG
jgi:hypothetical protein